MVLKRDNRSLSNLNYIDVYLLMYELVGVLKTIIWSSSFSIKQLPHQVISQMLKAVVFSGLA